MGRNNAKYSVKSIFLLSEPVVIVFIIASLLETFTEAEKESSVRFVHSVQCHQEPRLQILITKRPARFLNGKPAILNGREICCHVSPTELETKWRWGQYLCWFVQ